MVQQRHFYGMLTNGRVCREMFGRRLDKREQSTVWWAEGRYVNRKSSVAGLWIRSASGAETRAPRRRGALLSWVGVAGLGLASSLVLSAPAAAIPVDLTGDTITVEYYYPDLSTLYRTANVLVGAGVEINCPSGVTTGVCDALLGDFTLDFGADTVSFSQTGFAGSYNAGSFNGWVFSGLDYGAAIASVVLTSSSGLTGLDQSRVSFTGNSISLNLAGINPAANPNSWLLTVTTVTPVAEVPLPAALPLFASALGAFGAFGHLRKRRRLH